MVQRHAVGRGRMTTVCLLRGERRDPPIFKIFKILNVTRGVLHPTRGSLAQGHAEDLQSARSGMDTGTVHPTKLQVFQNLAKKTYSDRIQDKDLRRQKTMVKKSDLLTRTTLHDSSDHAA